MLVTAEAPDPVAGPGQVVIEVAAAGILFLDVQLRAGWGRDWFPVEPPYVPGGGVAGRVAATGEGVDPAWRGRPVLAYTGTTGGYAERVAVPAEELVAVPDGLDPRTAAGLLHDGATALRLAERTLDGIGPGRWALVLPAGGGLGTLLLQLTRASGATVVGGARGARKLDLARELGAAAAVDYSEPGWTERVREATGGRGPDLVLDGVGGELGRAAFGIAAPGARVSAHGAPSGDFSAPDAAEAARRGITLTGIEQAQMGPDDLRRLTARALAEAAAGRLRPIVGQTFPLERAAAAHAAIEARDVVGKTLLLTGQT